MKKIYLVLVLFFLSVFTSLFAEPLSSKTSFPPENDTGGVILLDWPDIPGAVTYRLQIALSGNFLIVVIDTSGLSQSQFEIQPGILSIYSTYYWHYKAVFDTTEGPWIFGGQFTITGVKKSSEHIPANFCLNQNYPNPFNPSTKIKFDIPSSSFTTVAVYDVLGKEISVLASQELSAGSYEVTFDGSNLPSGMYFYRLEAGEYSSVKKMIIIK